MHEVCSGEQCNELILRKPADELQLSWIANELLRVLRWQRVHQVGASLLKVVELAILDDVAEVLARDSR